MKNINAHRSSALIEHEICDTITTVVSGDTQNTLNTICAQNESLSDSKCNDSNCDIETRTGIENKTTKSGFKSMMHNFRFQLRSAAIQGDVLRFSSLMHNNRDLSKCLNEIQDPFL